MRLLLWASLCLAIVVGITAAANRPSVRAQSLAAGNAIVVDFLGPIERTGAARWRVAGQEITLDAGTVVVERAGLTAPGAWAHVQASWQDGGRLTAQRIETAQSMSLPATEPTLLGIITELSSDHWLIDATWIEIAADTLILGSPSVGSTAFAQLRHEADSRLIAAAIVAATPEQPDIALLRSTLVRFDEQAWELTMENRHVIVPIDAATRIKGQPAAGAAVEVVAWINPQDELRGALATVLDDDPQPRPFRGRLILQVTATDPEQWSIVVSGGPPEEPWQVQNLLVDANTTLIDERNGSIRPGAWVEGTALASATDDLPWTVRSVRSQSSSDAQQRGVVRESATNSKLQIWQLNQHTAILDSATAIDGVPRVGRFALVRGKMLSENTIWATEARMRYVFRGWLTARSDGLTPRQWLIDVPRNAATDSEVVGRVAVLLDDASFVDPALASDVLGVFVSVQARATPDGWLVETARLADFSVQ